MKAILHSNGDHHYGLAVARSLGKKNVDFAVISSDHPSIAAYSKYCRERIISGPDLRIYSRLSEEDIVFPLDEEIMLNLAKNASRLKCTLGFSGYSLLETIIHKNRMVRHAIDAGIPCPETRFVDKKSDLGNLNGISGYPVVLKKDRGAGGIGTFTVDNSDEIRQTGADILRKSGPFMIQEKIPYDYKCTVGVLCNRESKIRRICILKEVRNFPMDTGQSCCVETIYRKDLVDICENLVKSLGLFGVADIDFLIDKRDGKPRFMEINPRFWGSCQGAIIAGVDFPFLFYRMLTEGDIDTDLTYRKGVRCRYAVFNDLARLASIVGGKYPFRFKMRSFLDFMEFYHDDGYYVFSWNDLKPFLGLVSIKFMRYLSRNNIMKISDFSG